MVGVRRCYVPYCGHKEGFAVCKYYRFPSNPSRCKAWVEKVGVEDFAYQVVQKLHSTRFVCGCHFKDEDFCSPLKKFLKDEAVPSLLDRRIKELPHELLRDFSKPSVSMNIETSSQNVGNTQQCTQIVQEVKDVDDTHPPKKKLNDNHEYDIQVSPSKRYRFSVAAERITIKKILEDAGIPGAKITHDVNQLLQLILLERKEKKQLQAELDKYVIANEKLQNDINRCKDDNEALCRTGKFAGLRVLIDLNTRHKWTKTGGERYTNEEIILATGIWKRSRNCYLFLRNFIKLPNERSLKRALGKIALRPGINDTIPNTSAPVTSMPETSTPPSASTVRSVSQTSQSETSQEQAMAITPLPSSSLSSSTASMTSSIASEMEPISERQIAQRINISSDVQYSAIRQRMRNDGVRLPMQGRRRRGAIAPYQPRGGWRGRGRGGHYYNDEGEGAVEVTEAKAAKEP